MWELFIVFALQKTLNKREMLNQHLKVFWIETFSSKSNGNSTNRQTNNQSETQQTDKQTNNQSDRDLGPTNQK